MQLFLVWIYFTSGLKTRYLVVGEVANDVRVEMEDDDYTTLSFETTSGMEVVINKGSVELLQIEAQEKEE